MKNTTNNDFKHGIAKPMLCKVALQKKIDKNRDEIDKWLNGDYPLDLVYMRIRMLSAQNERLISQLKAV